MALFDYVQKVSHVVATPTASVTLTPTAGNILCAVTIDYGGASSTMSDGVNTWVNPNGTGTYAFWYALNVAGGSTTITATSGAGGGIALSVLELVGSSSVVLDASTYTSFPYSGDYTVMDSGSITTSAAVCGLVGLMFSRQGLTTQASGFTSRELNFPDANVAYLNTATQTTSSSGLYKYDPTTDHSNFGLSSIFAFKDGGGGGATKALPFLPNRFTALVRTLKRRVTP